jgi:hypothetical protein
MIVAFDFPDGKLRAQPLLMGKLRPCTKPDTCTASSLDHAEFVVFVIQVVVPNLAQTDALLGSGWKPWMPDAQADLESTVLYQTHEDDVAFAWIPKECWDQVEFYPFENYSFEGR